MLIRFGHQHVSLVQSRLLRFCAPLSLSHVTPNLNMKGWIFRPFESRRTPNVNCERMIYYRLMIWKAVNAENSTNSFCVCFSSTFSDYVSPVRIWQPMLIVHKLSQRPLCRQNHIRQSLLRPDGCNVGSCWMSTFADEASTLHMSVCVRARKQTKLTESDCFKKVGTAISSLSQHIPACIWQLMLTDYHLYQRCSFQAKSVPSDVAEAECLQRGIILDVSICKRY